jgi:Tol biopolymer transport system component
LKKIQLVKLSIILVALLMLISCATTPQAQTQTSLKASAMGFTKELDEPSSRGQLSRISPEQKNVKYRFCLSPDEETIIFSGAESGSSKNLVQLWKITSSGSFSSQKITSGGSKDKVSPSFTKDGKFIFYSSEGQIRKVKQDGTGGIGQIPGSGTNLDFAPQVSSKNILAFCSVQRLQNVKDKYLIWTSDIKGGGLTQIREGLYPQWSPDGTKIVFEHKEDIWLINADGSNHLQLTNTDKILEGKPSFSPDGESIVYVSNEDVNGKPMLDFNIWTMKIDASEKQQRTELSAWDSWPIWGKDGIYFLSARAQKQNELNQRIWKLNITSGDLRNE